MRKGFSCLSGLVRQYIDHELLSGDVFIFLNRCRDWIKLLMRDVTRFEFYSEIYVAVVIICFSLTFLKKRLIPIITLYMQKWKKNI